MHSDAARAIELILILLLAVAALGTLARRLRLPYPILLVLGGLALGFVPGLPQVVLDPDLVFLLFLPPVLYAAAWFTSWRDFKANLRPISLLAFGLVLATTVAVAAVAHADRPRPALGGGLRPRRARLAARRRGGDRGNPAARRPPADRDDPGGREPDQRRGGAGGLSLRGGGGGHRGLLAGARRRQLLLVSAGGIAIGLAVGWLVIWVERPLDDPPIEIILSFLAPVAAYLAAETVARLGRARGGGGGTLRRPAQPARLHGGHPAAGQHRLGTGHLPGQRADLHPDRPATPARPRRAGRPADREPPLVRRRDQPDGGPRPHRLGLPGHLPALAPDPPGARRASPCPVLAQRDDRGLHGAARGRLPGGGPGAAAGGRERRALPRPRPDPLPDLLRDPGHAGRAGAHPDPADPPAAGA